MPGDAAKSSNKEKSHLPKNPSPATAEKKDAPVEEKPKPKAKKKKEDPMMKDELPPSSGNMKKPKKPKQSHQGPEAVKPQDKPGKRGKKGKPARNSKNRPQQDNLPKQTRNGKDKAPKPDQIHMDDMNLAKRDAAAEPIRGQSNVKHFSNKNAPKPEAEGCAEEKPCPHHKQGGRGFKSSQLSNGPSGHARPNINQDRPQKKKDRGASRKAVSTGFEDQILKKFSDDHMNDVFAEEGVDADDFENDAVDNIIDTISDQVAEYYQDESADVEESIIAKRDVDKVVEIIDCPPPTQEQIAAIQNEFSGVEKRQVINRKTLACGPPVTIRKTLGDNAVATPTPEPVYNFYPEVTPTVHPVYNFYPEGSPDHPDVYNFYPEPTYNFYPEVTPTVHPVYNFYPEGSPNHPDVYNFYPEHKGVAAQAVSVAQLDKLPINIAGFVPSQVAPEVVVPQTPVPTATKPYTPYEEDDRFVMPAGFGLGQYADGQVQILAPGFGAPVDYQPWVDRAIVRGETVTLAGPTEFVTVFAPGPTGVVEVERIVSTGVEIPVEVPVKEFVEVPVSVEVPVYVTATSTQVEKVFATETVKVPVQVTATATQIETVVETRMPEIKITPKTKEQINKVNVPGTEEVVVNKKVHGTVPVTKTILVCPECETVEGVCDCGTFDHPIAKVLEGSQVIPLPLSQTKSQFTKPGFNQIADVVDGPVLATVPFDKASKIEKLSGKPATGNIIAYSGDGAGLDAYSKDVEAIEAYLKSVLPEGILAQN
ncbi:hypothetical protein FPQ18DRAFT_409913 [Pyronema domesticum]|nr:hypothetical protein FPQ18DRAFT_409913 [Pyronema domesticum]